MKENNALSEVHDEQFLTEFQAYLKTYPPEEREGISASTLFEFENERDVPVKQLKAETNHRHINPIVILSLIIGLPVISITILLFVDGSDWSLLFFMWLAIFPWAIIVWLAIQSD